MGRHYDLAGADLPLLDKTFALSTWCFIRYVLRDIVDLDSSILEGMILME